MARNFLNHCQGCWVFFPPLLLPFVFLHIIPVFKSYSVPFHHPVSVNLTAFYLEFFLPSNLPFYLCCDFFFNLLPILDCPVHHLQNRRLSMCNWALPVAYETVLRFPQHTIARTPYLDAIMFLTILFSCAVTSPYSLILRHPSIVPFKIACDLATEWVIKSLYPPSLASQKGKEGGRADSLKTNTKPV